MAKKKNAEKVEKVEKEEVVEETNEEVEKAERKEAEEEFFDKKKKNKKEKEEKSIFYRVTNFILWFVLIAWMCICLYDLYKVRSNKEPMFCIAKHTEKYKDGTVDSCTGLGYKVYRYKRKCYNAVEYVPFFFGDKTLDMDTCPNK
jgi:hypothetical protein